MCKRTASNLISLVLLTFYFLKATDTSFVQLQFFSFLLTPTNSNTHTHTNKLLRLASGVVINHQSEWYDFPQHQQS